MANFQDVTVEFKVHIKMAKDVQAQEAADRAFRREIVTDNFDFFKPGAKGLDLWDLYHRQVFCVFTHGYPDSPDWIDKYPQICYDIFRNEIYRNDRTGGL